MGSVGGVRSPKGQGLRTATLEVAEPRRCDTGGRGETPQEGAPKSPDRNGTGIAMSTGMGIGTGRRVGPRLNRRGFLRSAAGVCVALPLLEYTHGKLWAAPTPAKRFVVMFSHGGVITWRSRSGYYDDQGDT